MSTASPTAFLIWALLSVLFLGFLVSHLWSYDRFKCLSWSAGRQPGAFKRVMTYTYLSSVPLFNVYSIAMTVIKYKEGFVVTSQPGEFVYVLPRPMHLYSPSTHRWIIPLDFLFAFAWSAELITHLEELAFWLYLLNQTPKKEEWFSSWEYRLWCLGSITAVIGMPLTTLVARRDVDTCDAWIFLVGASGATTTTIIFIYVLWRFPTFIRYVKAEGADPSVVVRLATFYNLNRARVVFRFFFTLPLLVLAIDGIVGPHVVNANLFWTDLLMMASGVGCFVSSAITLLIFFPRSIVKESGYRPKAPTLLGSPISLKSPPLPATYSMSPSGYITSMSADNYTYSYTDSMASPATSTTTVGIDISEGQAHTLQEFEQAPPYALSQRHSQTLSIPQLQAQAQGGAVAPTSPTQPSPMLGVSLTRSTRGVRRDARYESDTTIVEGNQQVYIPAPARNGLAVVTTQSHRPRPRPRPVSNLHPYVATFTSPIDLADLSTDGEVHAV